MTTTAMKLALRDGLVDDEPAHQHIEHCLWARNGNQPCPHVQPEQPQQGGLEMVDDEGENRAVRMFLALYGGACGVTSEQMRKHLKMAGFDGAWPGWANSNNWHLTKAGAQLWIRHLFALEEQPAQQEPIVALELLSRCENEMRYAGWDKFESDNTARNGVYEQVKRFLEKNT